jgi:hypothetical protein
MIRPVTCVCMLLAAASGLYLYQTKHQAQLLDREIDQLLNDANVARGRANVLRAEYALENDPSRLADLAGHFLALKTTEPGQFTTWAELGKRLPPVSAGPSEPVSAEPLVSLEHPAEPARAAPPDAPVAAASSGSSPASAAAAGQPAQRAQLATARPFTPTPPAARLAESPMHVAVSASTASATTVPVPQVPVVPARLAVGQRPPTLLATAPAAGHVTPSAPVVASVLGMARTMTPTPLAAGVAVIPASSTQ